MLMTISFGAFLILLWNVTIFLGVSSSLAQMDKKRAGMFAILALIISIMPWIKSPSMENESERMTMQSIVLLDDGR